MLYRYSLPLAAHLFLSATYVSFVTLTINTRIVVRFYYQNILHPQVVKLLGSLTNGYSASIYLECSRRTTGQQVTRFTTLYPSDSQRSCGTGLPMLSISGSWCQSYTELYTKSQLVALSDRVPLVCPSFSFRNWIYTLARPIS